jgi:hypothetical protein
VIGLTYRFSCLSVSDRRWAGEVGVIIPTYVCVCVLGSKVLGCHGNYVLWEVEV